MKSEQMPPESLILDFSLYPRHRIEPTNVRDIGLAREAGIKLPPVIVDQKTKKVIDGFHRVTDALRAKLKWIAVEFRDYRGEADMLEDAIRLNMHGEKLYPFDKARCVQLADEFGLTKQRLALALHMTPLKLDELWLRKSARGPDQKLIPIKNTLGHLAGQKITSSQIEGQKPASGMRPLAYVNQVINLLKHDLIDTSNENLMAGLVNLQEVLEKFFRKSRRKIS